MKIKKILNIFYINVIIFFILFLILETISTLIFKKEFINFNNKILLYSENKVYENLNDIFLYKKNSIFKSKAYYYDPLEKEIIKEYEYEVTTNNAGLVQKKNIKKNKDTIFILGASETKGQGASPWFYKFEKNINNKIQYANIGYMGTGPAQQIKIMSMIKNEYNLNLIKIIFIITSGELSRNIWNFNSQQMKCLSDYLSCVGTENIYGYDFNKNNELNFAKKIYNSKGKGRNGLTPVINSFKNNDYLQALKEMAKNSYFLRKLYLAIYTSKSPLNSGKLNVNAIKKMQEKYPGKVFILHPSQKNQVNYEDSELLIKTVNDLNLNKNYYYCQLPPKIGFHKNDSHPNSIGYDKLVKCLVDFLN